MTFAEIELRKKHPTFGLALKTVDKILANLATSSFIDNAGAAALDELKEYRLDMALDIVKEYKA